MFESSGEARGSRVFQTRKYASIRGFRLAEGGEKKKRRGSSAGGRRARRRTPVNPPSLTGRRPAAVATSLRGAWGGGRGGRASGRARGETGAGGALAKNTRASEVHTRARGIWAPRADARGRTRDGGGARGARGAARRRANAPEPSQRLYRVRDLDVGVGLVRLARGRARCRRCLPAAHWFSRFPKKPPRRPAATRNLRPRTPERRDRVGGRARSVERATNATCARVRRRTAGEEGSEAKKTELRTCFVLKLAASRANVVQSAAPPPADAHRGRRTFFFRE